MMAVTSARKDLTHLCRALKTPSLLTSIDRLSKRARDESWSHEEFLAACLERELSSRQTHGGDNRIKAARFPQLKTLEDFDFSYQRSIRKEVVAHLGALDFVEARDNVIFLGPPGTGKSHLGSVWGCGPVRPGTGSRSRPQPGGSIAWARRTTRDCSTTSSCVSVAPRF
jgi:DNA replication protein DnaC